MTKTIIAITLLREAGSACDLTVGHDADEIYIWNFEFEPLRFT